MRTLRILLPVAILLYGCGDNGGGSGCGGITATAADIQNRILQPSCGLSSVCHDAVGRKANLDLSSISASCSNLRMMSCEFPTRQRIDSANPNGSLFIQKLTCPSSNCTGVLGMPASSCVTATSNDRMPQGTAALESCRIDLLRMWVAMNLPGC